jgi:hypothetical protein
MSLLTALGAIKLTHILLSPITYVPLKKLRLSPASDTATHRLNRTRSVATVSPPEPHPVVGLSIPRISDIDPLSHAAVLLESITSYCWAAAI